MCPFVFVDARVCDTTDVRNSNVTQFNEKLANCTVIAGDLSITLCEAMTEEMFQSLSFPELREIKGNLILFRVSNLKSLGQLFPNLALIRGNSLFRDYSLVLLYVKQLEQVSS